MNTDTDTDNEVITADLQAMIRERRLQELRQGPFYEDVVKAAEDHMRIVICQAVSRDDATMMGALQGALDGINAMYVDGLRLLGLAPDDGVGRWTS